MISPRALSGLAFVLATGALSAQSVTVVNMTPRSLSGETNCDGEPSIAVNPANPLQMAGTAFTPDPAAGSMAPYYVSTDGGNTWTLNSVMPGGKMTSDVSLRFGTSSNVLYAGILRGDNTNLNILRTSGFSLSNPMSVLVDRANDDQPFLDARTVNGADRVYIGNNNFAASVASQTATVDLSTNAATAAAPAGFAPASVEARATSGQDGPSVRAASAPDGRVYAALLGWRSGSATFVSDVVVVRDDAGATGATKFKSLLGSDGLAGTKVATGQNMTFNSQLGSDRVGSSLAIAVDPTDSLTVYVAWGEDGTGGGWTLHLRRSTDGGVTWSSDLRTIVGATNPALAINNAGEVGFFYQKLTGGVWNNQADFAPKNDPFTSPTTIVLANLPDGSTTTCGQPTIGDYSGLIAVGADFYGVFSGDNTPNSANFPHGVTYQRQVNWSSQQLLSTDGVTQVSTSLDPFFFHVSGLGTTATAPSITTQPASTTVNAGATATFSVGASGTAPLSYQWQKNGANIGGATSASYTTPATTSTDNGATFSATVSNAAGSATSNNATLTVVSPANTVTASITTPASNVTIASGTAQSFVGTGTDSSSTATLSYSWTFGDGVSATGASASHIYTNTGSTAVTYTATLKVTDNTGVSNTATRTITVNPAAANTVTASITTPASNVTIASGAAQSFAGTGTDSSSTATLSYAWTFGDGGTATGASASHTYTNTGSTAVTYTATLKVTDNTGISNTATRAITVNPAPG
ncbi:MAG TPA: PKD domain-containing protein, partial [Holophagaceae bacterium]|nr:PKD domain-containing protein [Holophagaceae bacterium]